MCQIFASQSPVFPKPNNRGQAPAKEAACDVYSPGETWLPELMKPYFQWLTPPSPQVPDGVRSGYWPAPVADAKGDYQVRTYFDRWEVADPTGLNVRMPAGFPVDYDSMNAHWPSKPDMSQDDTKVGTFAPGTRLTPVMGNMGILYLNDANGAPWMMVRGQDESGGPLTGFVRSNAKYIRPQQD